MIVYYRKVVHMYPYVCVIVCMSVCMSINIPCCLSFSLTLLGLELMNENYKPYKGVRTLTKSGKFLIRSS